LSRVTKPRWAAIVRVSHVGARADTTFHADEEQIAEIRRYAAQHGADVEFMEPELSVSGGLPIEKRPSLNAAIEGVETGTYDGIVVAYLSRLTRSRSGLRIWERVEAANGRVHCAAENLDTSTPSGRFVRDIHLANAVREREEHADRHAKRRESTVKAGIWRQRQTPIGYKFAGPIDSDGRYRGAARRLAPDDDAHAVRRAFRDRRAGASILSIADRLKMTPGGVRAMLRNRVYLGELHDSEHVNRKAHKAIVDRALFDAVQVCAPRPPRSADGIALLAGIIRCSGCGHVMTRSRTKALVYICPVHHSGGRCPAPASITAARVEEHVEAIALRELERLTVTAGADRSTERAEQAVADAETALRDYLRMVNLAGIDMAAAADAARERKDTVDAAKNALRAERAQRTHIPAGQLGSDAWVELNAHQRNALLRSLLAAVVVRRAGGRGARVPLPDRVRVLAFGADVVLPERHGERAGGIVPIPLPDLDTPNVLGMPGGEDGP
jgi:DNA invertase Pin-like site-specific DNA recombinase